MSKVLVIDAEKMICDLLQAVLSNSGHDVITASRGYEGVALFCQHRPQFTLLDLRMPDMTGVEVLEEIREVDPEASVIILTNWGTDQLEAQARQLGARDFFSKKMTVDAIAASMARALEKPADGPVTDAEAAGPSVQVSAAQTSVAVLPPASPAAPEGASILVVDDEPQIRDLLWQFLTQRGYRVRTVSNGAEALMAVEKEQPLLMLLDVSMPGMNGIEVLRHLYDSKNAIGVVLLTASEDEKVLMEAFNLGVSEIIGKPLDLERLALAVQIALQVTHR